MAELPIEEWQIEKVKKALAEAGRGDFVEAREIQEILKKWERLAGENRSVSQPSPAKLCESVLRRVLSSSLSSVFPQLHHGKSLIR